MKRLIGWLFGVRPHAEHAPAAAASANATFLLPMLFAAREPQVPAPTVNAIALFPAARSRAWSFAARIKAVASENVPKMRKGHRARIVAPAGKAVPKKRPHMLKVYKPGSGVPATAPWRKAEVRSSPRVANVVALAGPSRRSAGRSLTVDRLAA